MSTVTQEPKSLPFELFETSAFTSEAFTAMLAENDPATYGLMKAKAKDVNNGHGLSMLDVFTMMGYLCLHDVPMDYMPSVIRIAALVHSFGGACLVCKTFREALKHNDSDATEDDLFESWGNYVDDRTPRSPSKST